MLDTLPASCSYANVHFHNALLLTPFATFDSIGLHVPGAPVVQSSDVRRWECRNDSDTATSEGAKPWRQGCMPPSASSTPADRGLAGGDRGTGAVTRPSPVAAPPQQGSQPPARQRAVRRAPCLAIAPPCGRRSWRLRSKSGHLPPTLVSCVLRLEAITNKTRTDCGPATTGTGDEELLGLKKSCALMGGKSVSRERPHFLCIGPSVSAELRGV